MQTASGGISVIAPDASTAAPRRFKLRVSMRLNILLTEQTLHLYSGASLLVVPTSIKGE